MATSLSEDSEAAEDAVGWMLKDDKRSIRDEKERLYRMTDIHLMRLWSNR